VSSVRRRSEGSVKDYATLPYHLMVVRDDEEKGRPWTAIVEELPGCTAHGRTADEALTGLQSALTSWIEVALEHGREIPQPKSAGSHSGRLLLRMPRTLHAELTRVADREGVSLNQFITDALASAVAWRGSGEAKVAAGTGPVSQEPGVASLTADPAAPQRTRRNSPSMLTAALAANFVIVAIAGIVAIVVLLAAWH
jgi:predicted RNase H-like HicB family nuclease